MRFKFLLLSALVLLGSSGLNAQLLSEGFENGVPPTGWVQFENGTGTAQFWQPSTIAYAGSFSAYVRYENVSSGLAEDWLVTPALTLGSGDSLLSFYQRQEYTTDYGSVYTIRVSTDTSQTNVANFTTIDTQLETDFTTGWTSYSVSLAAYTGQTVYIAFVMTNDDGDNWHLDEMTVGGVPCGIFNLAASNITTTTADLSWSSISALNEVEVVLGGATPTGFGNVVSGNTSNLTNLLPGTTYDAYVRGLCNGGDKLIISGVWDGPLSGGLPKGAELYVIDDIADLSLYGISSANNGTGTTAPTPEFVFPAVSANAGDYIYIASDSASFNQFFGFDADYISAAMLINGDDAVELFQDTVVIDVFGDVNVDGSGTSWDYLDGWAYRMSGATVNGGVFVDTLWDYSGINNLEGGLVNDSCNSPFPLGTFTTAGSSSWSMISFTTLCTAVLGDSLPDAIQITTPVFSDSGNTFCYTDQIGNAANDVWYWTVITDPCAISIDVSLCGSDYDTYLRLYDPQLNLINSNDDDCGLASEILGQPVSLGDTIIILVEGYDVNFGNYVLNTSLNFDSVGTASISYPASSYCPSDPNPMANILADSNGVFSATPGLVIDSATGLIDIAASTAGTYAVVYAVGTGACTANDTFAVTLNSQDTAAFSYPSDTVCQGSANIFPVVTGSTGTFSGSGGMVINATSGEIDLTATPAGTYDVTLVTSGACSDSATVGLVVLATPSAVFSYNALVFCQGDSTPVVVDSLVIPGGTFTGSNGLVVDPQTGTIDLVASTADSNHTVTYTVANGPCVDSYVLSIIVNDCSVGIEDGFGPRQFSLYPVPNHGRFFLQNSGDAGNTVVEVTDLAGRVLFSQEMDFRTGDKHEIVLDNAAAGTYFLRARTEDRVETMRFSVVY